MAEREQRCNELKAAIAELEAQKAQMQKEIDEIKKQLHDEPTKIVDRHIQLLHQYNEIKDVGQGLMGLLADAKGVRAVDVYKEFGVKESD